MALVVKNPPANAGDIRNVGSIPGLGRSPGGMAWQPTPVFLPGESKLYIFLNLETPVPRGTKSNNHGCISLDKAVLFDFVGFVCLFLLGA